MDEVQLVWNRLEAIRVLKEAKRQGKGTLNQALHAECVWSAFPGRVIQFKYIKYFHQHCVLLASVVRLSTLHIITYEL